MNPTSTSSSAPARAIAERLVAARRSASPLADFPGPLPTDLDTAYAIQGAGIALWPDTVAGWKVGRLAPEWQEQFGEDRLVGPIRQVAAEFTDVMRAYAEPEGLLEAFRAAAREAIDAGATVIVPGEGPLNVFLADHGLSRVDDVPVLDSLGTLLQVAEMRARQYRSSGLLPSRRGFHHEQPPRELLDRARDFYGIPAALDR